MYLYAEFLAHNIEGGPMLKLSVFARAHTLSLVTQLPFETVYFVSTDGDIDLLEGMMSEMRERGERVLCIITQFANEAIIK